LKKLDLRKTNISDLSVIATLENLEELNLSGCKNIKDFSPLSNLKKLKVLDISETEISDLSPIAELTNLETLNLEGCKNIKDLSPLKHLKKLKALDLTAVGAVDLSPLTELENLEWLDLSYTEQFIDITPVIELAKRYRRLKYVNLIETGIPRAHGERIKLRLLSIITLGRRRYGIPKHQITELRKLGVAVVY